MPIRGKRIPLLGKAPTIAPGERSSLLIVPVQEEMRNGHTTLLGGWEARAGYESALSTDSTSAVTALIPYHEGIAVTERGEVYRASDKDWTAARLLDQRLEGPYRPQWAAHDQAVILCAGGEPMLVEGQRIRRLATGKTGIAAPSITSIGSGTILAGTYTYRVTLVTGGGESGTGTASATQTVASAGGGGFRVYRPTLTEDQLSGSVQWKVYRRNTGTNEDGLVGTAEIADGHIDDLDGDVGAAPPAYDASASDVPRARHIAVVGDYVVLAGDDAVEYRWSYPANHDLWPAANSSTVQLDGGSIQRIGGAGRTLWFFKTNNLEIHVLVGGASTFQRQVTVQRGLLAPDSLVLVRGASAVPYWLGDDHTFCRLNGQAAEPIGSLLTDEIRGFAHPEACYGVDFPHDKSIRWFFPHERRCFTFNYASGGFYEDAAWNGDRWELLPVRCAMEHHGKTYVGLPAGVIGRWDKDIYTDAGAPIRVIRRFSAPLSEDGREARVNLLSLRLERGTGDTSAIDKPIVTVRWGFDRGSWEGREEISLGDLGDTNPYHNFGPLGMGRELRVELECAAPAPFLVTAAYAVAQPLGDGSRG